MDCADAQGDEPANLRGYANFKNKILNMSPASSTKSIYSRPLLGVLVVLLLSVWGSAVAYYQAFSARQPYDDEGFLIGWVRSYLDGHPLYDEVHCFYGPAYFLYQKLGHAMLHSYPSTDSVRLIAISFWVLVSVAVFFLIFHITGSLLMGSVSYILTFRIAHFLGEEPGHPQELILLLAVIAMGIACLRWRESLRFFLLGVIAGTLTFTKINVGISLALALGIAFIFGLRESPFSRFVRLAFTAIVVLYLILLFWPGIDLTATRRYLLLEVCALLAIFVTIWPAIPDLKLDFTCAAAAACGFVVAAVALILYGLASGASIHGMVDYLVIRPRQTLGRLWYLPAWFPWWHLVSLPPGIVLAAWVRFFGPRQGLIVVLKFAAAASLLLLALGTRTGALFAIGPPLLWLIILPGESFLVIDRLGRTLVALIAVLLFTYAYPVAGVHVRLVDILLVIVAMLLLGDVVAYAMAHWNTASRVRIYRAAGLATSAVMLIYGGWALSAARETYYSESPLGLPGSARLRLPENEVKNLRTLVAATAQSCTFLVTVPAMLSFNEWTGLPSVSGLPFANWVSAYDDSAQARIIEQLSSAARPCVIENPSMIGFWTHDADMSGRPITVYTRRKLREIMVAGNNHLYAQ